ncbi:MAG: ABC transporter permease [Gemmatimonadetes bacterium]|nr:ABC transporter permease [Gemmatimonadota bacterium]
MRAVAILAISNLRRRRGQAVLVGTILGLSALLFLTGIGVLTQIEAPVHRMLEQQRASQLTFSFDARIHDPDSVGSWWRRQPDVVTVSEPLPALELRESSFFRGKQLSRFLFVTERPVEAADQDELRTVAGDDSDEPGPGEVWLPTALAAEAGIAAGDTLELPGADGLVPFVVGKIVVDPQFSGPFFNPVRVWVAAGSLPIWFQSPRLTRVMMAVRLATDDSATARWNGFVRHLGGAFSGNTLDRRGVIDSYTGPYTLMAGMIVAFSALGFLVALFAMQGTITSAILADYKTIGILRAQGFRPADVALSYRIQYLLLAAAALPAGALAGVAVVRQAIALLTRTVATPVATGPLFLQAAAVLLLFLGLVALFVARVTRAAARIQPAEAIRYGAAALRPAAARGIGIARLARLSVPMIVAIKNLGLQKRRAAFLAVAVVFATVAAALAVNLDYTFGRMTVNLAAFGFDDADVRITRAGRRLSMRHPDLMRALTSRAEVHAVATWDLVEGTFPTDSSGGTRIVSGTVVDGDMAGLSYHNLRGRNPEGAGEMSVAIRTALDLGLDVGSRVQIHVMGVPVVLDVVGVYQSVNNTGHGFRVRLEAIRSVSPLWWPSEYAVALNEGVDRDRFIAEVEGQYGEAVDAKPGDLFIRDQLASIIGGLRMTNGFLAFIFLAAAAVFIVNTTLLTIAENRRIFGILKTTGMTPAELRTSVVAGVGVQSAVGIVVGLLAWFFVAPLALAPLFGAVGLVSFPLEHSLVGMAILTPAVLVFCLAAAWLPSGRVLDVQPRALIVE